MTTLRPTTPTPKTPALTANNPRLAHGRQGRRKLWQDPRLALGIVLIAGAAAVGGWAVDSASQTQELYALATDIAPGTDLTQDGVLTIVASHPGTGNYLRAGELPEHAVATRSLSAGELLPTSAVATQSETDLRAVVLPISTGLPKGIGVGDRADLWLLPKPKAGEPDPTTQQTKMVAASLTISSITAQEKTLVGSTENRDIELLVPAASLPDVLGALAADGALVLVPVGAGA